MAAVDIFPVAAAVVAPVASMIDLVAPVAVDPAADPADADAAAHVAAAAPWAAAAPDCISLFAAVDTAGTVFGITAGVFAGILSVTAVDIHLAAAAAAPVAPPVAYPFVFLAADSAAVGVVSGTSAYVVAAYMFHNFDRYHFAATADEDTVVAGTLSAVAFFYTASASVGVASTVGFAADVGIFVVSAVFLSWFFRFLSLIGDVSVHFSTTVGFLILMPIDDIGYFVINASAEVQP